MSLEYVLDANRTASAIFVQSGDEVTTSVTPIVAPLHGGTVPATAGPAATDIAPVVTLPPSAPMGRLN